MLMLKNRRKIDPSVKLILLIINTRKLAGKMKGKKKNELEH